MGFESAYAAHRRLAVLASASEHAEDALGPSLFAGYDVACVETAAPGAGMPTSDIAAHLDELAQDIIATPGAGGALLLAFAAQARALALVMEAALRTQSSAMLPTDVLYAVQAALRGAPELSGLELAWQR